nr:hypothetical protein BaRGS_024733 [Batillaria attramentaria]
MFDPNGMMHGLTMARESPEKVGQKTLSLSLGSRRFEPIREIETGVLTDTAEGRMPRFPPYILIPALNTPGNYGGI